ncbi:cytochrome c oxidase subunit IV-domain-containing protein [Panaeolus papilionaceus]|nr:cytochrome c oxidase subunit IV-domain-containing protein [Panaeolus papilionaceus]
MQALRLARAAAVLKSSANLQRRCLATATADLASSSSAPASSSRVAPVHLSNVEAQWAKLSSEDKAAVHEQLEALQVKDWKELSIDEKKAAYYVAFGPHGPRAPTSQPGDNLKIFLAVTALVGSTTILWALSRYYGNGPAKTMTKEWQEASNERALEMNLNPISGISSEGYQGKGFVQSK